MVWFWVDDNLAWHRKTVAAGNAAMGLWTRAGSWCAQQLSDGFLPHEVARSLGSQKQIDALILVGLWVKVDGGYQFWQWDERNPTRAQVEEARERKRKAGHLGGRASGRSRREARASAGAEADTPPHAPADASARAPAGAEADRTRLLKEVPNTPPLPTQLLPPSAGANPAPRPAAPDAAQTETTAGALVADWLDHVPKRPPESVIAQTGKHLKALLAEGIDPADIRQGLAAWATRGLHPSTLPSVVNEVMNCGRRDPPNGGPSPSRNAQILNAAMQRAQTSDQPPELPWTAQMP